MSKKKIITHSGGFHADDVFAVATLHLAVGKENIEVIRSRDPEVIKNGDYVVDVGFVYDPDKNLFDHHQEGGAGKRENGIPYASFGLVWKKFGKKVSGSQDIADVIEKRLVQTVDGPDSGVVLSSPTVEDVWPYSIGLVMSSFEPAWGSSKEIMYKSFLEAVCLAERIIKNEVANAKQEINSRKKIEEMYNSAENKEILVLENTRGWSRQFIARFLEQFSESMYFVRQNFDGTWQAVAVQGPAYKLRKPFPESWAGKRDEELAKITGVPGAFFCHSGRFMCVAGSKEGAIRLAQKALETSE